MNRKSSIMSDLNASKKQEESPLAESGKGMGILDTPVLFTVFNRPEHTRRVFESIRSARPMRLYIACDGPRENVPGDFEAVETVRSILNGVDWPCAVMTLFQERNLGLKKANHAAFDWYFSHEEYGIILEDDCLPDPSFYGFCTELLRRYASDERVWMITGDNFQNGKVRGKASYYFSRHTHVWGWATWRRCWSKHDKEMSFWPHFKASDEWMRFWTDAKARRRWEDILDMAFGADKETWSLNWMASVWRHGGLDAVPNVNLVSNIGFGEDATNTKVSKGFLSEHKTAPLGEIRHPREVTRDTAADDFFNSLLLRKNANTLVRMLSWLRSRFA